MRLSSYLSSLSIIAIVAGGVACPAYSQDQDLRKEATDATRQANAALLNELPFDDTTDFDDAKRGLIAPLPAELVKTADGNPV